MAAVAGGMLASAVLKVVFKQIGAVVGGQITLQQDFTKDLLKMKMILESVSAVLKDAERKSVDNTSVQLWLMRLKNAMYDISDMLDEFEADTQPAAQKMSLKKSIMQLTSIGPKTKLANRMKKMREELKEITDQHVNFRLEVGSASNDQKFLETRETTVLINDEEVIVGRTGERMKIMVSLSKSINEKLTIFPIYGNGGIGKTTMAKMLFNDTVFNEYSRVWVYVSQMFDLKKIGNSIISQLSKIESQITEMQMIRTHLVELLGDKNILIVLDDLWEDNNQFQLDELKKMLNVNEDGKVVVIVTTRNESIANDLGTIQPYKLALLSDESCWAIIKQRSDLDSRSDDKKQLEHIGKDIARKCGGVALAAKVLGHMLRTFTFDEWESVSKSNIWNVSTSEETQLVLSSLKLTYSYMPSPLRLCFAYCAIFPKGQNMIKDDLIHQWISLGFIDTTHVLSTRQLGEKYIAQLLELSFLEHSAIGVHHKDVRHLTMHDLVHDLARLVLADELILGVSNLGNTDGSRCRYALLDDCSMKLKSYTDSPAKIRAMRFLDCRKIGLHSDAFSSAKYLRVLDLSECFIQELPDSVGQLKLLRYLNAPKIQHWMIPNCITKLSKLYYLSFSGSDALLALPDSIGKMESLMYLNLSGCSGLEKLPVSFAKLKKLVHLDLSNCTNVTGVSESLQSLTNLEFLDLSYCWNIKELPEHLGSLLKLKYLNMSGCDEIEELPRSFGNLKNLVHLDLSHCCQVKVTPEVLDCLTKLQYLNLSQCGCIDGTNVAEAMGNLTQLRQLHLSGFIDTMCHDESTFSTSLERISTLSNLEHLDISCNVGLVHLPECFSSLSKLHALDLSDCSSLRLLPESIVQMDSLKMVYAKDCRPLVTQLLVTHGLNQSLIPLPELEVQAGELKGGNIVLFHTVQVTNLTIHGLDEVNSFEEAQSIKLVGKQGLQNLRLVWRSSSYHVRVVEDSKVLGGLEPPSTIKSLDIDGYNDMIFPDWLMGISHNNFPNLVSMSLVRLANCIDLPPLGQLPNLRRLVLQNMPNVAKIDEDFCGGTIAFPQLASFTICIMESLEVWNTRYSCGGDGVSWHMFPNLHELKIFGCPKLRLKPCPPKAEKWTISGSDSVISSWGESMSDMCASTSSSPLVTTLTIEYCKLPMHQWRLLHHLHAISNLRILFCSDLTSSPEIIGALSALQSLSVWMAEGNHNNEKLLEWVGHLTSLENLSLHCFHIDALQDTTKLPNSLQWLELDNCESMTALPLWVGDLMSLKRLKISSCKNLKNLQIIGSLTPLQELHIWCCNSIESTKLPNSLQSLELDNCESMTALPLWVGDLMSLKRLKIESCKNLKSLQIIGSLTSLQEFHIGYCSSIESLPESISLTSLQELHIWFCTSIESLPESIQQLTNLEKLQITGCPALQRWCETEENKMKLAHIKEKIWLRR